MKTLVDFLIRYRLWLLLVVVVLLPVSYFEAKNLAFDQSIESLYAEDDERLNNYLESKSLFGGDEFVIVAYTDPQLISPGGIELSPESAAQIRELSKTLSDIPGVRKESTQNLADALKFPWKRSLVKKMVEGILLGEDQQTTAIVLRLQKEDLAAVSRKETFAAIREIAKSHNPPTYVVGEPLQVHDMFRLVEEDGQTLFMWSLGLLAFVVLVLFRSVRWMVLPLLVVIAAILWTEAVLVLSGIKLSMVSSMLNSLVTIIGIATVMHVTVHYRDQRRERDRIEALKITLTELLPAIFWTCATTSIGFLALLSSSITPVQSFGTMMSLATFFVLLATATILPGGILLGRMDADPSTSPAENRLVGLLEGVTRVVSHRPRLVSFCALFLVGFAAVGFQHLKVETDFSKNFRKSSSIVQSLDFVETKLGGAGTWEVNFPAPAELNEEFLDKVRRFAEKLREKFLRGDGGKLTKVVALTDGLDLVPKEIPLPFGLKPKVLSLSARLKMLNGAQPEYQSTLYNPEQRRMRIVLRAKERQPSADKLQLIEDVEELVNEEFSETDATGLYVLLAFLIDSLLRDQLVSFALAATGISLMMMVAFRSVWIGLVSLIPNLFPIVLVIGIMGWIGLPINIATAMIASVSMGLTIDSSIHYISGYRRARKRGHDVSQALRETHRGVGRALVFASIALIVGFSVLTLSHFIPLIYFGILVSVAMFGGLMGNLFLLPILLRWVEK
jgi:predicted RND superfamily exporter protein